MMSLKFSPRDLGNILSTPQGTIILYVFANSLAGSMWTTNAWTPFIYQIFGNSNFYVGLMSALNGGFQLIFALLGGYFSDRVVGPSQTLLISIRIGILSLLFVLVAVWSCNLWLLIISQSLFGTYAGLSLTSIESVFAQCIGQGERDHLYAVKFSLESAAPIGGLVLSLALFALIGNTWRVDILRWVITAGVLLHIASMQTFFLRFKPLPNPLEKTVEDTHLQLGQTSSAYLCNREEPRVLWVEEEIAPCGMEENASPISSSEKEDTEKNLQKNYLFPRNEPQKDTFTKKHFALRDFFFVPLKNYPRVVVFSDFVITFGSGMTTQYFSLFMMNIYHISPVGLTGLGLLIAMGISILAIVNATIARRFGRTRAILPPKLLGTLILLYMALARETSAGPTWLMCIAYVARMALMNCTTAVSRALIMDLVSERRRGMWNAVESIQSASWSGTAVLGGVLADQWGYGAAFIVTFAFHLSACVIMIPCLARNDTVLALLPKNEATSAKEGEAVYVEKTAAHTSSHNSAVDEVTILGATVTEDFPEMHRPAREICGAAATKTG